MNDTTQKIAAEAKKWAADYRKWITQDVVEQNLIAFAQFAIEKAVAEKEALWIKHSKQYTDEIASLRAAHASEPTQNIAEEAVEKFAYRYQLSNIGKQLLHAYIQSAIEKAKQQWIKELASELVDEVHESRAAHASEADYSGSGGLWLDALKEQT